VYRREIEGIQRQEDEERWVNGREEDGEEEEGERERERERGERKRRKEQQSGQDEGAAAGASKREPCSKAGATQGQARPKAV
jgi:hypothetical protein